MNNRKEQNESTVHSISYLFGAKTWNITIKNETNVHKRR